MTKAPKEVRHEWKRRPARIAGVVVYECLPCGSWTGNLPLYRYEVCDAKDRRKGERDRRAGRAALQERA